MAAPDSTKWGNTITGSKSTYKGKIGIYTGVTTSNTEVKVTVQVWFWSMYGIEDINNSYYYNANATAATTLIGAKSINHTVSSGSGWSTSNQTKLGESTYTYTRGTSASTKNYAAKFTGIDNLGASNVMSVTASVTVPALASYSVTYNANGGSGAPSAQTKWYGKSLTLSTTKPTRTGYSFQGWGTSASDTSVDYAAGASYTGNANITLYAIWKANTYTVSYNANGGSGAPGSQTKTHGVTLKLSTTKPTRTNYNFKGWGTSASATAVSYQAGSDYTANANVTLYAIWEIAYIKPRINGLSIDRCTENGVFDDEGTYIFVNFDWVCDLEVEKITVQHKLTTEDTWTTEYTYSTTNTYGTVSEVIGRGLFDADRTYDIRVSVADANGETIRPMILPGINYAIDVMTEGKGIAFGKPSELEGYLESKFKAMFYDLVEFKSTVNMASDVTVQGGIQAGGGIQYVIPVIKDDLDDMLTSGNYYMGNDSTNRPVNANGWLEVQCYGNGDYCYQKYITYTGNKYERWRKEGVWGDWKTTEAYDPSYITGHLTDAVSVSAGGVIPFTKKDSSGSCFTMTNGSVTIGAGVTLVRVSTVIGGKSESGTDRIWCNIQLNGTSIMDAIGYGSFASPAMVDIIPVSEGDVIRVVSAEAVSARGGGVDCRLCIERIK